MREYLSLVLVKLTSGAEVIYKAPAWCGLRVGEEVVVEVTLADGSGAIGEARGNVLSICCVANDSEEYGFVKALVGVSKFNRVIKRVKYVELTYEED